MADDGQERGISRRSLLVGGGAGAGLLLAWALWPRSYAPNLRAAPSETVLNAFLKIATDGRVIVAVPQAEIGQGVYTSLPQILADELGADWRTVGVEPAPIGPLYANALLAEESADEHLPSMLQGIGRWAAQEYATRGAIMLTGGSSSIRAFEGRMREAGAAARALLSMAAADRWNARWEDLDTRDGFVWRGAERISFGELAEAAAGYGVPDILPVRGGVDNRLVGQPLPRIDLPAKVDGSAQFAGDVRLPNMVYAAVRQGPSGSRLDGVDRAAANDIAGVLSVFEADEWAGAVATNWWAAARGVEALQPRFRASGLLASSHSIEEALNVAQETGEPRRAHGTGDIEAAMAGGNVLRAAYSAGLAPGGAIETLTATARLSGDRLEVWAPTQAPSLARTAAARAAGMAENQVTIYPMLIGGGYGRKLATDAIAQVAVMAVKLGRPVQLVWPRMEETLRDRFRPPALARMSARLGDRGMVAAWQARIAAPAGAWSGGAPGSGGAAVAGAVPPYAIPAVAIDHVPVEIGVETGVWRSGAHSYTAFFTECFIDELSRQAGIEPLSFRMQILGANTRLARALSTAAALGGWDGGGTGSALGIAAHSAFGSHAATLVEVEISGSRQVRVTRAVCAVDCGRIINPEIVRQQIEGGIIHGISGALGAPIGIENGVPDVRTLAELRLPILADSPEVQVEMIESGEEPGGVTELAVPTVAPAIANAVYASTGQRLRALPLQLDGA